MVFVSIITLFGLGLVAAILLSIASRVFYVLSLIHISEPTRR